MGDVYMVNGKILSGLPNHAKDIEFDNTGTDLTSTNTEDAIKEVNSNLYEWNLQGTGTSIAIPTTYKELLIVAKSYGTNPSFNFVYTFNIPKAEVPSVGNTNRLFNGYGWETRNNCQVNVTNNQIELISFYINGTEYVSNGSISVYYR